MLHVQWLYSNLSLQADPKLPVLAPGDKEKKAAAETDARGYVRYVKQQIESSAALAERLKIKPMEVKMEKWLMATMYIFL